MNGIITCNSFKTCYNFRENSFFSLVEYFQKYGHIQKAHHKLWNLFIVGTSAPCDQIQTDCQACATETQVANSTHGGPSFWSEQATKLLLSEIKSYEETVGSGRITKKKMFIKIAATLKEHGYIYTWEQVQGRYKTLTTAFKTRCVCETQMPPIMANSDGRHYSSSDVRKH